MAGRLTKLAGRRLPIRRALTATLAVANSRGMWNAHSVTQAKLLTVMMGSNGASGYAQATAPDVRALDAAALGEEAADKALLRQLSSYPTALGMSGAVMILMSLLPGIPMLPFLALGGGAAEGYYEELDPGPAPPLEDPDDIRDRIRADERDALARADALDERMAGRLRADRVTQGAGAHPVDDEDLLETGQGRIVETVPAAGNLSFLATRIRQ